MRGVLAVLILGAWLTGPAWAGAPSTTLEKIKATGAMTIGHRESSAPFSFVDDGGKPAGYSVDLCLAIAAAVQARLGLAHLDLRWTKVTVEDRLAQVARGDVDIECGSTTTTLGRREQVDFTLMTFVDGGSLLVTDASAIDGVGDLGGKGVAVIPGTTTEGALAAALRKEGVTPRIVTVRDHAEGLAALEKGTVDAYASDRVILVGLGRQAANRGRLSLAREYFSYEPYALVVRRGDPDFRLLADRTLAGLYRSGRIFTLVQKWFKNMGKPSDTLRTMYFLEARPE